MTNTEGAFSISFGDGVDDALEACLLAIGGGWVVQLTRTDGTAIDVEIERIASGVIWGFEFVDGHRVSTAPVAEHLVNIQRLHVY